jgi:hypothetical protein
MSFALVWITFSLVAMSFDVVATIVRILRVFLRNAHFCRISGQFLACAAVFLGSLAFDPLFAREKPTVTFTSECSCEGNHGVSRWAVKTDTATPPLNLAGVQAITPADMFGWSGPGIQIPRSAPRIGGEEKWYAVTGRIDKVRVEDDGDLHIVMNNVNGRAGGIVVELPLGPTWCEMRKKVFSWTNARFPFPTGQQDSFSLLQHPVVTVIGKAFYDIDHSGSDTSGNRRNYDQGLAVWEIHPVMQLSVGNAKVTAAPPQPQAQTPPPVAAPPAPLTPIPTTTPQEFVTITQPVTIKIPYGITVLQPGMRLPIVSHDAQTVHVRYLDQIYPIPVTSTDLK